MSRANVYIIAEQDGPRKIGISDDPVNRILSLQAGRSPLSVVASYLRDGGDAGIVERIAHRLLKEKRVVGEWFDVIDDQAIAAVREAIALVDSGDLSILTPGEEEFTEGVSLALSKWHIHAIDEWRPARPDLPTRAKAMRLMVEAMTAGAVPKKAPASGAGKPARKAPRKGR